MKEPNPEALKHSQRLRAQIIAQIVANGGKISFTDYMQQALYAPGLGYYNAGAIKFGSTGDFVTAPELGKLFARCVAQQCAQILTVIPNSIILEIGAGSGQLACDLLLSLKDLNIKLDKYLILELSAELKQRQQQTILQQCPEFFAQVQWLDSLPTEKINGIILANEVLDAMPTTIFSYLEGNLFEHYVQANDNIFQFALQPAGLALQQAFTAANLATILPATNYQSEINLWLPGWIKSLSNILHQGAILLFDYGFGRSEFYHPQRNSGTLMCHYQHHNHTDPFLYPGLQDITTHVDFTAVAEAADASNLTVSGYTNLASFLINCGIASYRDMSFRQAQEINLLVSAAEMGELFKAMLLTKMPDLPLLGFSQFDKLHSL